MDKAATKSVSIYQASDGSVQISSANTDGTEDVLAILETAIERLETE